MPVQLTRRVRTSQPTRHVGINEAHPSAFKVFDGWLAHSMQFRSCRGRAPNAIVDAVLTKGLFGVGISAKSGGSSIKYNVGAWGQSGSYAFLAVCEFIEYTSTYSIVRRDGVCTPAQIAASNVRAIPWSPLDTSKNYFGTSPSGVKLGVFIANRVSQSTFDLWSSEAGKVNTTTALTGYGTTSNPLCFMGTESNTELATSSSAKFYGGVAFNKGLTDAEAKSFLQNPWQLFSPETIPLFWSGVTAQFLRPISDVSNSGWTPSSGSDLFPMIGETTRNDTTYISATEAGAWCEVLLGTSGGDPLSSVNHLPRIVMSAGSGGIIVRLKQGATLIKEWTYSSLTGTDTLYEPTLTGGEIDSITDYTDLRLYLETTA